MGDDVFAVPMQEVAQLTDDMMAVLRKGEDEDDDDDDDNHKLDGGGVTPTGIAHDGSLAHSKFGSFSDRGCRYPFANNNWSDLTTVDFSNRASNPVRRCCEYCSVMGHDCSGIATPIRRFRFCLVRNRHALPHQSRFYPLEQLSNMGMIVGAHFDALLLLALRCSM